VSAPAITVNYHIDLVARIGPAATSASAIGFGSLNLAVDSNASNDTATNTALSSGCPLPDLQVTLTPFTGSDGGSYVRTRVENVGATTAPATTLHRTLHGWISGRGWYVLLQSDLAVPSLDPGEFWVPSATYCEGPVYGLSVQIDPAGHIVEPDESNNSAGRYC
jgi:subtilase family serine protease